jgi:hypothetical protein
MQAEDDVHDTENRPAPCPGLGVGWMLQLVPFQRSVIVLSGLPKLSTDAPTAVQADDDVHETPNRTLECAPDGFGVGCTAQAVPFQRSASVTPTPELSV